MYLMADGNTAEYGFKNQITSKCGGFCRVKPTPGPQGKFRTIEVSFPNLRRGFDSIHNRTHIGLVGSDDLAGDCV